jgi:hypothetical protein
MILQFLLIISFLHQVQRCNGHSRLLMAVDDLNGKLHHFSSTCFADGLASPDDYVSPQPTHWPTRRPTKYPTPIPSLYPSSFPSEPVESKLFFTGDYKHDIEHAVIIVFLLFMCMMSIGLLAEIYHFSFFSTPQVSLPRPRLCNN